MDSFGSSNSLDTEIKQTSPEYLNQSTNNHSSTIRDTTFIIPPSYDEEVNENFGILSENYSNKQNNNILVNSGEVKPFNNFLHSWELKLQIVEPKTNPESQCINKSKTDTLNIFNISCDYTSAKHANVSFTVFQELWERKQVCDVIIKVGGREFPAHRIILCATIPYFNAMFTNDLAERNQSFIELKSDDTQLTADAFESLLRYAYTGKISINFSNVQSIMIGASFLALVNVQQACSEYLKYRLNTLNVLNIKSFAFTLGCCSLFEASKRFIYRNFEEISKISDFLNLSLNELVDIICCDELNICSEKIVFEAVVNWINHDVEKRQNYFPIILKHVRLPLLEPEYLTDVVMAHQLIKNSLECRDLVDEAKDYYLLPERRNNMNSSRTRPRSGYHIQGCIYAVGGLTKLGDSMSTVEVYDPHLYRWRIAEAMSMMRSRVGVAVMDGKLYAIGGYNGIDRLNMVEVYDSKMKYWKRVNSMKYCRSAVGAAALNGNLYVCGGYNGLVSLDVVERYIPNRDCWTEMAPMKEKRSAAGVVALDGYIYAIGGHDGLIIFKTVERYDPRTDKWEYVEPMLTQRCRLGVAVYSGKIYVCGGYDGFTFLQTAEVFDPQTNSWSQIANMNITRSRVALVANCSKLYAIGGYDGVTNLSSMETYDVENNTWEMAPSMVAHEGGVGVGVVSNN